MNIKINLLPSILLFASVLSAAQPIVWVVPSLSRVGPTDAAGTGVVASLSGARGEYESLQIVVRGPTGGLSNVNVTISDLRSAGGHTIPRTAFTFYREHFVNVTVSSPDWGGTNRPKAKGWYPDGLIPFVNPVNGAALSGAALDAVPFSLASGRNQPIWVDVLIPRTATAGTYAGIFTVTSNQGNVSGIVLLRVWNFTLPLKPSLRSAILLNNGSLPAYQELLRNKIEPLRADPGQQRGLIDGYGLGGVGLNFWSGADITSCSMQPAPSVASLQASVVLQQPDLMKYVYSADEIDACPGLQEPMKAWGRNLHSAGVNNLVVMSPVPGLLDDGTGRSAVDIWVQLPAMYDRTKALTEQVIAKGDKAWSYNTLVQDAYSPKWLIDFSPMDFRIQPGFINQSLGLTGLLYWRADLWSADPWNNVHAHGLKMPGEGQLVYPGGQVGITGVAPSMRLKWLRDGVEDYEYIEILKQLKGAEALLISRTVAQDWTTWTRDPEVLETGRTRLAEAIEAALVPPQEPKEFCYQIKTDSDGQVMEATTCPLMP